MGWLGILILLLFLCELVSSLSVNLSCPEKVESPSEFICNLLISNSESNYDVKLDFLCNEKRVSKLWNSGQWKSSNYYITDFISVGENKEIKVKIENLTENCGGFLKLRKTGKNSIDYQQNVSISLSSHLPVDNEEVEEEVTIRNKTEDKTNKLNFEEDFIDNESQIVSNTESIIKLNSNQEVKEIIYQSKDEIIRQKLLVSFSVFLLIVILILIIKK